MKVGPAHLMGAPARAGRLRKQGMPPLWERRAKAAHSPPVVAEGIDLELVAVRVCGQRRHMSML